MYHNKLESPCYNRVRLRKPYSAHEFVVPFNNFAPLPSQSKMIRQIMHKTQQDDDDDDKPLAPLQNEEEEDTIPIALLAYKKGILAPDKIETMYPLIQHIPSQNITTPSQEQRNKHYYHYPSLVLTHSEPNIKSLYTRDENTRRQSSYF